VFTVACVMKSGGIYTSEWVGKLQRAVSRNLTRPHRFVCFSDVEVPCERIALQHDWPGWWSKIEMFKSGALNEHTLYLDLDTAITGSLDGLTNLDSDFAMLQNLANPEYVGSGVMWFRKVPTQVYTRFAKQPDAYIAHYDRHRNGSYVGDQAFIADTVGLDKIDRLTDLFAGIKGYKYHCKTKLPPGTSIVCFSGDPKPTDVNDEWLLEAWH
jgi:hypothetical protein